MTNVLCHDETRRQQIREHHNEHDLPDFNGIDYVEVSDDQLTLSVYFLRKAPRHLRPANVRIEGGRRVRDIRVTGLHACRQSNRELDDCLQVKLDKYGDFSCYTLRLVEVDERNRPTNEPFRGFDPRYAQVEFSFKAGCPSPLDCLPQNPCPPTILDEPPINYLAKDYASFRQLIYDRLALLMPDWKERHAPDLGVTLVEILAYVGDYLSYYQDAVATEAYLETARRRISVRRHARLVDYAMHEGCNARAFVTIETNTDLNFAPQKISFVTGQSDAKSAILAPEDLIGVPLGDYETFEPMSEAEIPLYQAHSEIRFYTWGDGECCLPTGATRATLVDEELSPTIQNSDQKQQAQIANIKAPDAATTEGERKLRHLEAGQILIFEEVLGPKTGAPADADAAHSHAVRLTKVTPTTDELYNQPIVEIEWAPADALPFALCLSSTSEAPECRYLENVSVARGNVLLVDHGRTLPQPPENLDEVPSQPTMPACEDGGCPPEIQNLPGRFNPYLKRGPLTFAEPISNDAPASSLLQQQPRRALPQIQLTSAPALPWKARPDLLDSGADDADFVVEMDDDGRAHLRFGDGELGRALTAGASFSAIYRVGNGRAGNVGREAIAHLVTTEKQSGATIKIRNPLPASGGTNAEPVSQVKMFAPTAFRNELQRAITAADYARLAQRDPRVQRAAATLRWTGSWQEVLVAIDPKNETEADDALLRDIARSLAPFRRIGHDVAVVKAVNVPLDIELTVCVQSGYLRGHVEAALRALFGNRALPDGSRGFFHPDNLTFGEGVAASRLIALAQGVAGVENVVVSRLQRWGDDGRFERKNGFLSLDPLEVARLDNDPNAPENGVFKLKMGGGR